MPTRNRVNPLGVIQPVPERWTCMGNRGILHDDRRRLQYYHRHKSWVICKLNFKEQHRRRMTPGHYTELFFLDEATALAAGHRPCGRCSHNRYNEFLHFWQLGNPDESGNLDDVLHRDRFKPYRSSWRAKKRVFTAPIDELPTGVFIILNPDPTAQPYLILDDVMLPWNFDGYEKPVERRTNSQVVVLTPRSTVRALQAGYRPKIYPEEY